MHELFALTEQLSETRYKILIALWVWFEKEGREIPPV
jgi:hypothetical protein